MPKEQPSSSVSLPNFDCSLSRNGELEYVSAAKWKLSFVPPAFPNAELVKSEHFVALRSTESEIGFSFEKDSAKHFFVVGVALQVPKFTLKLKVSLRLCSITYFGL